MIIGCTTMMKPASVALIPKVYCENKANNTGSAITDK